MELSSGLKFKSGWNPSRVDVASDRQSATWTPEAVDVRADTFNQMRPNFRDLEIQTQLTSDNLDDIPLEDRCITAWVADSTPPPAADYVLGSLKQCLGDAPTIVFQSGQIGLFTVYPCAGVSPITYPCRDDDNDSTVDNGLELVAGSDITSQFAPRTQGVGRWDDGNTVYLRPGSMVVQVKDPVGREVDSSNNTAWWIPYAQGVSPTLDNSLLTSSDWTHFVWKISPVQLPTGGHVYYGPNVNRAAVWVNTNDKTQHPPGGLTAMPDVLKAAVPTYYRFTALGTYVVDFTQGNTHNNGTAGDTTDDVDYTATGTYTFHVGPIAELEVRDDGANPELAAGQRAYTIVAVNNGPDIAPAAQVTVTNLSGYVSHSASAGSFDSGTGVWTIGELQAKEVSQIQNGRDGEILTIVITADVDTGITAEIENTLDYQVCIDSDGEDVDLSSPSSSACTAEDSTNTWHTTEYYDYDEDNDSATIKARDGTGADLPSLRGAEAKTAAIVVTWAPVTQVSGRPVSHYEVGWSADGETGWQLLSDSVPGPRYVDTDVEAGDTRYYQVRAVNDWGHKGPWSQPILAMVVDLGAPGISISESAITLDEGDSAQYTVRLQARPLSEVTLQVDGGGAVSPSPSRLIFTHSNFSTPQTVTLTGIPDNDAEDDVVDVTHSISSSDADYRALTLEPIAVTVIDDDSAVSIASGQESVNEGRAIEFTLTRIGNTDNAITAWVYVSQTGDFLASGESGRRSVDFAVGETTATITVATDNDTAQENPGSVIATVQGAADYFVGSPASATVSVADDDGPPGQPGNLVAEELDESVRLTWSAAPSPSSDIQDYSYRVRETIGGAWDPDWMVIPNSGPFTTGYTVTGLENGTEYTIQVRASNASGAGSAAAITANPKAKPGRPDITVASRHESLLVTWHVPDDGGRDISEYQVQWKSGNEAFDTSRQATANTREQAIPDLTNGTEYQVQVRAMNEVDWGDWSFGQSGTPMPRPATSLSITTGAEDGVAQPFRVTFTFTDEDHEGNRYGVEGFAVDDIEAYYIDPVFEFTLADFKVERSGFVYSALVDQLLDATLYIDVPAGAARSTEDEQKSTSGTLRIKVEPPAAESPTGTKIWSAEMTVGNHADQAKGYINSDLTIWDLDQTIGSLSDGDDATDGDDTFTYSRTHYTVGELSIVPSWNMVIFVSCPGLQGANAAFDLFLDDQGDGHRDLTLSFDPDVVDARQFTGTIDGQTVSCVEYRWTPQHATGRRRQSQRAPRQVGSEPTEDGTGIRAPATHVMGGAMLDHSVGSTS